MKTREKLLSWLFVTPFDFFLTTFVLVFAKFAALFALREDHWLTR